MTASLVSNRSAASNHQPPRKPDFFILGAPKAGTTSLYAYLAAHPRIFLPRIKEPFFFCSDFPAYREQSTLITDLEKYLRLFAGATAEHLACGEASPLYLYSQVAVRKILAFNPAARFIVMLRNPVDLAYSLHSQVVRGLNEPVTDFEQAWRLQEARAEGRHVPKKCLNPGILQYRAISLLGEQMERLLKQVSRERVKILLLEELAKDPKRVYEDVLGFLGVPSDGRTAFPKENAHQVHRIPLVARLIKTPPFPLNVIRQQYRFHVGVGSWPARIIARLNRKNVSRKPMSPELRRELEAEFHGDIRLLERLIERDLSHWIPDQGSLSEARRKAG